MKRVWTIAALAVLLTCSFVRAQLAGLGEAPVEITSDGETHFEQGVAIAENNVQIHFEDVSIYCDHAEYNPDTRDVLLVGNVRIYSPDGLISGQRALYNLQNKQMRALNFSGSFYPALFRSTTFRTLSQDEFRVRGAYLTTDDSSQPGYHMKAKTMRFYKNDCVVFLYSTLYVGETPVFWFPYLYSSVGQTGFSILPGDYGGWGFFVQLTYSFAYGADNSNVGTVHFDYRQKHGIGLGFDSTVRIGKNEENQGNFLSYWTYDTNPLLGINGKNPLNTPKSRYRVSYNQHLYLTDDIYATCDLTALSDSSMMQDFFPFESRTNPQPDNNISLTKWSEYYTLNLLTRFQMNNFQTTVERLPEFAWDIKQNEIFGTPLNFDGSNTLGQLRNTFGKVLKQKINTPKDSKNLKDYDFSSKYPNYSALRFDSFSQISLPKTYFGWLSITPRAGFRMTAYNQSGQFFGENNFEFSNGAAPVPEDLFDYFGLNRVRVSRATALKYGLADLKNKNNTDSATKRGIDPNTNNQLIGSRLNAPGPTARGINDNGGTIFRPVVNFGIEASFKLSHAYERIQSQFLGLDGVMNVIQPYANYSLVENLGPKPNQIYQFDTVQPNTQPMPINFPDFQGIDAIDSWSILRLGVRNNFLTRRDNANYQWITVDNFFDYNFKNPYFPAKIGNMNTLLTFNPSSWISLSSSFQLPLDKLGFTEFNTAVTVTPCRNFQFTVSHIYLNNYPQENSFGYLGRLFENGSQITLDASYRLNDNWSCSLQEQYDYTQHLLMYQRYMLNRDLTSWVASLGLDVRKNQGEAPQTGVVLVLTLKAAPQVTVPLGPLSVGSASKNGPIGPGGSL